MKRSIHILLGILLIGSAHAADVPVPNYSFESPDLPDGTLVDFTGSSMIPNWTRATDAGNAGFGAWNPQTASFSDTTGPDPVGMLSAPADGLQVAQIHVLAGGPSASGRLTSDSFGIVEAATNYVLSVALGNPLDTTDPAIAPDPATVSISLLVNGTVVATNSILGTAIPNGGFLDLTTSFTTLGLQDTRIGGSLAVRLTHTINTSGEARAVFDNVRLTATPVPEPNVTLLIGSVSACYLLIGRRRKFNYLP